MLPANFQGLMVNLASMPNPCIAEYNMHNDNEKEKDISERKHLYSMRET